MASFSVIIPAYNAAQTIGRAIRSVEEQTHAPHQVIVVDDGSEDDTVSVVEGFANATLLRQENSGPGQARNRGVEASSGEWVVFLDADDYWAPSRLEAMAAHAAMEAGSTIITTDAQVEGDQVPWRYYERARFVHGDQRQAILRSNFVFISAAVQRRLFDSVGGFDPPSRFGSEDWDLWIRAIFSGARVGLVEEVLACYTRHDGAMSANREAMLRSEIATLRRALSRQDLTRAERRVAREALQGRYGALLRLDRENLVAASNTVRYLWSTVGDTDRRSLRLQALRAGLMATPRVLRRRQD